MITTGAKLWLAIALTALLGAGVYFVATGRGEDGGTLVLASIAAGCAVLAAACLASRDGDASIPAGDDAGLETVRVRSSLPAFWPALGAVGAGVAIVGYAAGGLLLYAGIGIIAAVIVEWMVQSWAERSTADPAYNQALRNRIMFPFEVPVLGIIGLALVMVTFSRVLLAVSKTGSTVVAMVVATVILAVGALIANRPKLSSGAVTWAVAIGAVGLLAAGVVGGVAGEREIEAHHAEEGHDESEGGGQAGGGEGNAGENDASEGTVGDDGSQDEIDGPSSSDDESEEEAPGQGDDNTEVQTP